MEALVRNYIAERMNTMFEQFFEQVESARIQLLEGAITYEEFFNKVVAVALDLAQTNEYNVHVEREWKPKD